MPEPTISAMEGAPFVVCDDVRVEVSGKHMLIGVYPGNIILVSRFPADVSFVAWGAVRALKSGKHKVSFRLESHEKKTIVSGYVNLEALAPGPLILTYAAKFTLLAPAIIDVSAGDGSERRGEFFPIGTVRVDENSPKLTV